jgi:DNA polymerase III, delta subunit
VLALPDPFAGVHGQDPALDLLRRAIATGRVGHAYAFVGPGGAGRKRAALAFARALVAPEGGRAADRVERGVHPDVQVIEPTPPEENPKGPLALRIAHIRRLERLAALKPFEAGWKVFILDQADRMTAATPQAFLKTLEEPTARTVIILILEQVRSLPATVLSRCQLVRFRPPLPPGAVALLPSGSGDDRAQALRWLAEAREHGAESILKRSETVGRDRQGAERMIETWWLWYRDLLCSSVGGDQRLAVFGERPEAGPPHPVTTDDALDGLAACREAWQAVQGNVNPRLTLEVLLSRLVSSGGGLDGPLPTSPRTGCAGGAGARSVQIEA